MSQSVPNRIPTQFRGPNPKGRKKLVFSRPGFSMNLREVQANNAHRS